MKRSFAMLKHGDVINLVRVIAETHETEIGCDECFEQLDRFAETEISGAKARAAMPLVADHLDKCADCRSKLEALLRALRSM
jgi:hypothetical protein